MATTYPKSKAGRKATTRKARAILCMLAASPEARLLLIGEHTYILAGREHMYLCSAVYEELRGRQWISTPQQLGDEESGILAATLTKAGQAAAAQCGNASYQQLLFEEIEAYIEDEARKKAEAQQARAAGHQPALFEEPQDDDVL